MQQNVSTDGRTCLHAAVSRGDADTLNNLLRELGHERATNLLKQMDRQGDTVLHLAVRRNRLDIVKRLVAFERELFYSPNRDNEIAIYVAVKLGFLSVVQELVNYCPQSIEIASNRGKNILHLVVELSQDQILKFLVENKDLSKLINQPDETAGDTPLHIAAINKNVHMVDLLLKVPSVDKDAVNRDGFTPLDIARENTEYDEPYKIIEKLSVYPSRCRPFLYSAPTMRIEKQKKAVKILEDIFADRRNVELVVATLLATMTFTAVFTVPGVFSSKGPPVLIGEVSFIVSYF